MDAFDLIEVVATVVQLGQTMRNVYHMVSGSAVSDADVLDDVAGFLDTAYSEISANLADTLTFDEISAKNLTSNVDYGSTAWPTLTAGEVGGTATLPTQVAGLITFPTSVPKKRGRKFIYGWTENDLTSGLWTAGTVTLLESFAAVILAPYSGTGGALWRYTVYGTTGGVTSGVLPNAALVGNIPSTLTRRRIGVGE